MGVRGLRKLPTRTMGVVLPLLLSIVMTFVVSGVTTVKSLGFVEGVVGKWMTAWALSWAIAFPVLLVTLPAVRRVALMLVEMPGERR